MLLRESVSALAYVLLLFTWPIFGTSETFASTSESFRFGRDVAREKVRLTREKIRNRLLEHHEAETLLEKQPWKNPHRRLDEDPPTMDLENDPCAALVGRDVFGYNGGLSFAPSYWQACAESLLVDAENMLLHIASLDQLFRDYQ